MLGRNKVYTQMDQESQFVMTGQMTAKEKLDHWAKAYQETYGKFMVSKNK